MNKIIAGMLLCMLALMPFALGDNDTAQRGPPEHVLDRVSKTVDKDMAKQRVQAARERIKAAKDIRKDVLEKARARRAQVEQLRADLEKCRMVRTEECNEQRRGAQGKAIEHLKRASENVLDLLERTLQRVTDSDLSEERKQTLMDKIERSKEAVLAIQDTLDAFDETTSKGEIKQAARDLRHAWKDAHTTIKHHANIGAARKLGNVIEKSEKLQERLENAVAKLEEQGKDTSSIDIDALSEHLEAAREAYEIALQLREKATLAQGEQRAELVKQSNEQLRAAHAAIKEAHQQLREILRSLRDVDMDDMDETEDMEDADSEDMDEMDDADEEPDDMDSDDESEDMEDESDESEENNESNISSNTTD